ncbi:uncharacterized protein VP01_4759g1 [Puccinia sorghi]|uniref:Uncharacterized protein n=1 Tax=Puccinia sorghi TaxID=27349 RepID=A0A0L6UPS2_9BASI|nr:uncharacterized protein VP01_4759g1 [Puccinia sorghi]
MSSNSNPNPNHNNVTEISPRAKFLSKPTKYKDSVTQLLTDCSNIDRWKHDLNCFIFLNLELKIVLNNPKYYR